MGQTSNSIYVRAGKNGKGYLRRLPNGKYGQPRLAEAIERFGWASFISEIVDSCETLEEANAKEHHWCEKLGAYDPDKGYNSRFVDSHSFPEASKKKAAETVAKLWQDPEYRARQLASRKGKTAQSWKDPEIAARRIAGLRKSCSDPEKVKARYAYKNDPVYQEKVRQATAKQWADPVSREKLLKGLSSKEARDSRSVSIRKRWAETGFREELKARGVFERISAAHKIRCSDPKVRQKMSESYTKEAREKKAISMKVRRNTPEFIAAWQAAIAKRKAERAALRNQENPPTETEQVIT